MGETDNVFYRSATGSCRRQEGLRRSLRAAADYRRQPVGAACASTNPAASRGKRQGGRQLRDFYRQVQRPHGALGHHWSRRWLPVCSGCSRIDTLRNRRSEWSRVSWGLAGLVSKLQANSQKLLLMRRAPVLKPVERTDLITW